MYLFSNMLRTVLHFMLKIKYNNHEMEQKVCKTHLKQSQIIKYDLIVSNQLLLAAVLFPFISLMFLQVST